jgi:hypothetical protein
VKEQDFSSNLRGLLKVAALRGLFLKMFPGCSTATMGKISEQSLAHWSNSGMAYRGEFWTLNTLEHPSVVVASTLSQVIEASAPAKYFLKPEQARQLIDRVSEKTTSAPSDFLRALEHQASSLYSMPQSGESRAPARKPRDSEMTEKPTLSTAEGAQTLFARRMLPSECERLQGFPKNWTAIDIEQ